MNRAYFADKLDALYAIHSKKIPEIRIASAIFKAVETFPDEFMDFAVGELKDYPTLPSNLPLELRRVLWPAFLDKNPKLRAYEVEGCDSCRYGRGATPGWLYVHNPDTGAVYLNRCPCRGGEQGNAWTWQEIREARLVVGLPKLTQEERERALSVLRGKAPRFGVSSAPMQRGDLRHVGDAMPGIVGRLGDGHEARA